MLEKQACFQRRASVVSPPLNHFRSIITSVVPVKIFSQPTVMFILVTLPLQLEQTLRSKIEPRVIIRMVQNLCSFPISYFVIDTDKKVDRKRNTLDTIRINNLDHKCSVLCCAEKAFIKTYAHRRTSNLQFKSNSPDSLVG